MNKCKVLLSRKNSAWGVIAKPQSSNIYKNILSFKDESTKEKFISKELFNDINFDWKNQLEQQPERFFAKYSSLKAKFKYSYGETENFDELFNKDFAIIKENNKISYWAITNIKKIAPGLLEFFVEKDIFFNIDITKNVFDSSKQTIIKRSHLKAAGDYNSTDYLFNEEFAESGYFLEKEINNDFDCKIPYFIVNDFDPHNDNTYKKAKFFNADGTYTSAAKTDFNFKEYLKTVYIVLFKTESQGEQLNLINTNLNGGCTILNGKKTLFKEYYNCNYLSSGGVKNGFVNEFKSQKLIKMWDSNTPTYNNRSQRILNNPKVSKTDLKIFNLYDYIQLKEFNYDIKNFLKDFVIFKRNNDFLLIQNNFKNSNYDYHGVKLYKPKPNQSEIIFYEPNFDPTKPDILIRVFNLDINYFASNEIKGREKTIELPIVEDKKLYRLMKIKSNFFGDVAEIPIKNLNIENNQIKYKRNLFTSFEIHSLLNFKYASNIPIYSYKNNIDGINQTINNSFIGTSKAFDEWTIRNKASIQNRSEQLERERNFNLKNSFANIGIGAAGGAVAGGPLGAGLGAAVGIGKSIFEFFEGNKHKKQTLKASINAQIQDLKSTPSTFSGLDTFGVNTLLKTEGVNFRIYTYPKTILNQITQFFKLYGYNIGNQLKDINKYLKNRKNWNYIETGSVFENFKINLSSEEKQIISNSLENGLFIWNIDDVNNFKGVNNFQGDNPDV